jgi:exopolyphosphatase/pppGpp-phosphohydrolase
MATDTWLLHDPPTPAEREACAAGVAEALSAAPSGHPERGIATGGTATTLPRLLGREHLGHLDHDDLGECRRRLARHPSAQLARAHSIDPVRARVLAGGVEILAAVMSRYRLERFTVSLAGVRDGMILAYLERGEDWVEG